MCVVVLGVVCCWVSCSVGLLVVVLCCVAGCYVVRVLWFEVLLGVLSTVGLTMEAEGCKKDRAKSESLCSITIVFVLSDSLHSLCWV